MTPREIVSLRKSMRLTQEAFADTMGVSFCTVNRWENGKCKPQRSQLNRMQALSGTDQRNELSEQVNYWTGRLTLAIGSGQFREEVRRMLIEATKRARSAE